MQILEFLKVNNIKWFPLELEVTKRSDGSFNKIPKYSNLYASQPTMNDFKTISLTELKKRQDLVEHFEYIAIDTTHVNHIDVDFKDDKEYDESTIEYELNLKNELPYFKSITKKKGKHYFFKNTENIKKRRFQTEYEDIEILNGQWSFCKLDCKVKKSKRGIIKKSIKLISEANISEANIINYDNEIKNNKMKASDEELEEETKLYQMSNIISLKYLDSYDDWIKIIWALRNDNENNYKLAKQISMKSTKYQEKCFNKIWNCAENYNITLGSLFHFAKISNEKEYFNIISNQILKNEYLCSDDTLAKIFLEGNELDYIYKDEVLYCFHKNRWTIDKSKNKLSAYISDYLSKVLKLKLDKLKKSGDSDEIKEQIKELKKNINSVYSTSKISSIVSRVIQLLSLNDYDDIEFDKNGYLFNFKNKTYDFKSHIFVNTRREDYILTTCGYNYKDIKDEDLSKLDILLNQIFPDINIKNNYVQYMATALYGVPIEKFIIANGTGGNGKGVLNELLVCLLGEGLYAYTAPNNVLLQPLKTGSNPEVANMSGKRLIIYREPDSEKSKLNGSTMKELTGGSSISARMNYSNDMRVVLKSTHILECNKRPLIDGRIDESYKRRLADVPFDSTFTNNKELLDKQDELDNIFTANSYYKSEEFKEKYKFVLFKYLINFCVKFEKENQKSVCEKIVDCDKVIERVKDYLEKSDDLYEIFQEEYIKTDNKNDFIKISEIHDTIKDLEYYKNLTKMEKRNFTIKSLIETIKCNINFRSYYKERYRNATEKIDVKHVLLYHKSKDTEEVDENINELDMF